VSLLEVDLDHLLPFLGQTHVELRVSYANKRFDELCRDASLWKELNYLPPDVDLVGCENLIDSCSRLEVPTPSDVALAVKVRCLGSGVDLPALSKAIKASHVRRLYLVVPDLCPEIVSCLAKLTHLTLVRSSDGLEDDELRTVADHCRRLEEFGTQVGFISDDGFAYFVRKVGVRLRCLHLLGEDLTDESIQMLAQGAADMECVTLNCRGMTATGMEALLGLPKLTWLELICAPADEEEFAEAFATCRPQKLTTLHLYSTLYLDDRDLWTIAAGCPGLTNFCLKYDAEVQEELPLLFTAAGIRAMLWRLSALRHLELGWKPAPALTAETFAGAQSLRELVLAKDCCPESLERELKEAHPDLDLKKDSLLLHDGFQGLLYTLTSETIFDHE
jgi:hypothetical protein